MLDFERFPITRGYSITAYMRGDSMEPTIRAGDLIFIDHSQNQLVPDGMFAIRWNGRTVVKRYIKCLGNGAAWLMNDNRFYAPTKVEENEPIEVIGRVMIIAKAVA